VGSELVPTCRDLLVHSRGEITWRESGSDDLILSPSVNPQLEMSQMGHCRFKILRVSGIHQRQRPGFFAPKEFNV
jgi:hypothetical protein